MNLVIGTPVLTTSGVAHDFAIPAGVKSLFLMLSGVSTDSTSLMLCQLMSSGAPEITGYVGGAGTIQSSAGHLLTDINAAASIWYGVLGLRLFNPATNTWIASGGTIALGVRAPVLAGSKSLASPLTGIRLTSVSGTANFDAGSANVGYFT